MAKDQVNEAEDDDEADGEEVEGDGAKKGFVKKLLGNKKMLIIAAAGLLVVLGGGGAGAYFFLFSGSSHEPAGTGGQSRSRQADRAAQGRLLRHARHGREHPEPGRLARLSEALRGAGTEEQPTKRPASRC